MPQTIAPTHSHPAHHTLPTHRKNDFIEYDDHYVSLSAIPSRSVTPDMLRRMHMSTLARAKLPPKLTNDALIQTAEQYINQCTPATYPGATYDQSLIHLILPEFIRRLKAADKEKKSNCEGAN